MTETLLSIYLEHRTLIVALGRKISLPRNRLRELLVLQRRKGVPRR
ncbi:MAG: hypothetical protein ACOC47_04010 [Alkalispirochaetaceae bacterium]